MSGIIKFIVVNGAGLFRTLNSNPGLKINQIITVSFIETSAFVLCTGFVIIKFKIEGQEI